MESYGFRYSKELTDKIRKVAREEWDAGRENPDDPRYKNTPDGNIYNAQHVWLNMQVFINPVVASLPEHQHLLAEHGCYNDGSKPGSIIHQECGKRPHESVMPPHFQPLETTRDQDQAWLAAIREHIQRGKAAEQAAEQAAAAADINDEAAAEEEEGEDNRRQ